MHRFARIRRRPDVFEARVRLPAARVCRPVFVCPACGRVHLPGLARLWWVLALLPAWWLLPRLTVTGAESVVLHRTGHHSPGLKPGAVIPGARTPGLFSGPGAPGVPSTAVIWNRSTAGTYLWSEPGGRILSFLENGAWLELLDEWQSAGGVPFGAVRFEDQAGWADMRAVHRLPQPDQKVRRVLPASGGYLYASPGGPAVRWLPPGTPLLPTGRETEGWLEAALLVGRQHGWLRAAALGD